MKRLERKIFYSINATNIVLGNDLESNFIKFMTCSDRNIFKAFVHDCDIT